VCNLHSEKWSGRRSQKADSVAGEALLVHGQETTSVRIERRPASARLAGLEVAGHALGFMHGSRTRGRKPALMDESLRAFQEVDRDRLKE
jgi:hypothetical protein